MSLFLVFVFTSRILLAVIIISFPRDMTEEESDEIRWSEEDSLQAEGKGQGYILRSGSTSTEIREKKKKWSRSSRRGCQGFDMLLK